MADCGSVEETIRKHGRGIGMLGIEFRIYRSISLRWRRRRTITLNQAKKWRTKPAERLLSDGLGGGPGAGRVRSADILKGIAIIAVILGHLGSPGINRVVFTFHVTAFYLVTGYFMDSGRTAKDFVRRRARALLPPYAATCLVIVVLAVLEYGVFFGPARAAREGAEWIFAAVYGAGDSYERPFHVRGIGAVWFLWASFWGSAILRKTLDATPLLRMSTIAGVLAFGLLSPSIAWLPLSIQAGCLAASFMYVGWLARRARGAWLALSGETKAVCAVCAALLWLSFIRNFTSFWLVHCDIGNGVRDVFCSLCACGVVVLVSFAVDRLGGPAALALAWIGRHSLLILCIHNIELDIVPWRHIADALVARGLPAALRIWSMILGKSLVITAAAFLTLRSDAVRRLFGYAGGVKASSGAG